MLPKCGAWPRGLGYVAPHQLHALFRSLSRRFLRCNSRRRCHRRFVPGDRETATAETGRQQLRQRPVLSSSSSSFSSSSFPSSSSSSCSTSSSATTPPVVSVGFGVLLDNSSLSSSAYYPE